MLQRLRITDFNWRMMLVRIIINALTLLIISVVVPRITIVDPNIRRLLWGALVLGLLNALVKPILQFLTLSFIFVTYGFAVVIINTIILLLLAVIFPNDFIVDSIFWALVAGLAMGLITGFLESLFGLAIPILPDKDKHLKGVSPAYRLPIEQMMADSTIDSGQGGE